MVSLCRHQAVNTSGSGVVFFDSSTNMDDDEYLQPVISSEEQDNFQKLETIPIVAVPLIFSVALEISGIIFVSLWPKEVDKCETYFILLYLHCAYWILIMVVDYFIKARHHNLRISGYLDFYQSTYQHIRTPLFIVSLCNTFYLFLAVVLHQIHKADYSIYCKSSELFTPLNYIFLFTTIEVFIIVPTYVNYIKRVHRFNYLKPPPDVTQEEWLTSFNQDSYAGGSGIGFHQRGSNVTELLEKQADLIRYLRDHNVNLSHRMMLLASQRTTPQT